MLQLRPMDTQVPIFNQLGEDLAPVILINIFTVDAAAGWRCPTSARHDRAAFSHPDFSNEPAKYHARNI